MQQTFPGDESPVGEVEMGYELVFVLFFHAIPSFYGCEAYELMQV